MKAQNVQREKFCPLQSYSCADGGKGEKAVRGRRNICEKFFMALGGLFLMALTFGAPWRGTAAGTENENTAVTTAQIEEKEKPMVALTFDDGPSIYSEALLDGLKERKVQATFFLLGINMEGKEDLVKRMEEEGHLLGNHSYHHVQLNKVNRQEAKEEILATNNRIYEACGEYPMYIRPPFGEWDETLDVGVEMIPVFWTVDSLDWKLQDAQAVERHVLENVEDGDIILMHDGYETSVEAALAIVDRLLADGYRFVKADQMLMD